MMTVIRDLQAEGRTVTIEDLAVISPYITENIKRFGDYPTDELAITPAPSIPVWSLKARTSRPRPIARSDSHDAAPPTRETRRSAAFTPSYAADESCAAGSYRARGVFISVSACWIAGASSRATIAVPEVLRWMPSRSRTRTSLPR